MSEKLLVKIPKYNLPTTYKEVSQSLYLTFKLNKNFRGVTVLPRVCVP